MTSQHSSACAEYFDRDRYITNEICSSQVSCGGRGEPMRTENSGEQWSIAKAHKPNSYKACT